MTAQPDNETPCAKCDGKGELTQVVLGNTPCPDCVGTTETPGTRQAGAPMTAQPDKQRLFDACRTGKHNACSRVELIQWYCSCPCHKPTVACTETPAP